MPPFRILILAPERVSESLAGPNIRAIALARRLGEEGFDATLGVLNPTEMFAGEPFAVREWARPTILRWMHEYDAVISQGTQIPAQSMLGGRASRPLRVFDLYDPILFEQLADRTGDRRARAREIATLARLTRLLLKRGDWFLCATPRQRDLWLGALYALGRIAERPGEPPREEDFVGLVPFGHRGGPPPTPRRRVLRGARPEFGEGDRILLWGGGVWNWFDPETLVRAMAELRAETPPVRLFFLGTRPAGRDDDRDEMPERTKSLARDLGLLGTTVVFNDVWIPFADVPDYLIEADLAVCTAPRGLENSFSVRTRLLDAVWGGVPIVCTREGFVADRVESLGIGRTVPAGDPVRLRDAIREALRPEAQTAFRANLARCRDEFSWENAARPLVEYFRRAAAGEIRRAPERFWKPWTDYAQYKLPVVGERIFGDFGLRNH